MVGGFVPVWAVAACTEQIAQSVVREVPEAPGNPAGGFDDAVDGFGGAVRGALGLEVGQDLLPPGLQCPAEAGDFGDRAGRERGQCFGHEFPASFWWCVVDGADLLVALPGEGDFMVRVPGFELRVQPGDLFVREVLEADL